MTRGHTSADPPDQPTPAQLGYAMPPEWSPHAATWIAWPHYQAEWPGKFEPIPWIFADIVRVLAQGEHVNIFVEPPARGGGGGAWGGVPAREVRDMLVRAGADMRRVTLHVQRTDRIWTRDSGPIFIQHKTAGPAIVDFKFNAWARYDNFAHDDLLAQTVARRLKLHRFEAHGHDDKGRRRRFVLEGGSIDVNGQGSLLTTEECLLSRVQQRNPGFSRERIEQTLCDHLGVTQILWLGRGIEGDDTHGHVDDMTRFVNAGTIVTAVETHRQDVNFAALRDNRRRLAKMRDPRGKPFTIVDLPMPGPVVFNGKRLPASYANFYIATAGILVPVFNDPHDGVALRILEQCFKGRPIIPIYCRDLVLGLGTLHCMTQQQPA